LETGKSADLIIHSYVGCGDDSV